MDISIIGNLPNNYTPINNGWPILLSGFFSIFSFENSISYMELQRSISIIISVFTLIPIYYLCRKFVNNSYSIIGAAIFVFEPRIIQNSLFGIADPLYIFLTSCTLVLIFNSEKKYTYFAFVLAAFATIVRGEGLFLFIAISIIYLLKYRKNKKDILKYAICISVFLLILMPMSLYKVDIQGTDGVFFRISSSLEVISNPPTEIDPNWVTPPRGFSESILTSLENFPKYLAWSLIPIFVFFVPIGAIFLFKKIDWLKIGIIISMISISLPAVFAYSLPLQDTRYFYFLYPLFSVVSVLALPKIFSRFKKQNLILLLIIIGIIISSTIFMEFKMWDIQEETEKYEVAKFIVENTKGINQYYPGYIYIESAEIPKLTKDLRSTFFIERENRMSIRDATLNNINIISPNNFNSIYELIEFGKKNGLTHIIIDNQIQNNFLDEFVFDEKKHSFLIKEFDSKDNKFKQSTQIYKINFDEYYKMKN
jgi:hypothetical protein